MFIQLKAQTEQGNTLLVCYNCLTGWFTAAFVAPDGTNGQEFVRRLLDEARVVREAIIESEDYQIGEEIEIEMRDKR